MELCCLRADSSSRQPYKQLLGAGQCLALARVAGFEPSHSHCNLWTRQCSEFHFLSPRAVSSLFCPTSTRPAKCGGPPSRAGQEHLSYPSKLFLVVFSPPQSWSLSWQVRKECGPSALQTSELWVLDVTAPGVPTSCVLNTGQLWGRNSLKTCPFLFLSAVTEGRGNTSPPSSSPGRVLSSWWLQLPPPLH